MNIKIKIIRFENQIDRTGPIKIVGMNLVDLDNEANTIYHETILDKNQIHEKTPEECIDIAYAQLSSSLAVSYKKLKEANDSVVGAYYVLT
jgi:hypothetical protein